MTQGEKLALYAGKVRASSLKRFLQVSPDDRVWRPAPGRLSFVDHLKHLIDCDRWVLALVRGDAEPHADILPGEGVSARWDDYLVELEVLGLKKVEYLGGLSDVELDREIEKPGGLRQVDIGSLFLRGNIEHEVQHRGMVQLLLRMRYG